MWQDPKAAAASKQHLDAMRVRQAHIHKGEVSWHVTTANGYVVRGPFDTRGQAEDALQEIRERAEEDE